MPSDLQPRTIVPSQVPGSALTNTILTAAPHAILLVDETGRPHAFNVAVARLFEHEPEALQTLHLDDLLPSVRIDAAPFWRAGPQAGQPVALDVRHHVFGRTSSGEEIPLIAVFSRTSEGDRLLYSVFVVDLTDRAALDREVEALRQELIHAGRIGEMGEMASAIAHELAQPMAAARNYLYAARVAVPRVEEGASERITDLIARADAEMERAASILSRLRTYMRKSPPAPAVHDLNAMVHEAVVLGITGANRLGVSLDLDFDPSQPSVEVDKVQIQQVIVNLVRNAVDALRASEQREVAVATRRHGDRVSVEVRDTGPGIAPEMVDRLFQPFTTTKPAGMGLGLSISRRIIEAHGGTLHGRNRPQGGALFECTLPLVPKMPTVPETLRP